jgi:hypothetical protein
MEEAPQGLSLSLSHTLFSSLLYKGKRMSPYARARLNKKSFGRSGTRLVIPSEHTSTLSLLGKRQAELRVVLAGRCPNQTRAMNTLPFHRS